MTLTKEQIEQLRWSLRANLPNEFNEDIDALCDMALRSLQEDKESGSTEGDCLCALTLTASPFPQALSTFASLWRIPCADRSRLRLCT